MNQIKAILKQFNLFPQKGLGQHFLVNDAILEKIVRIADVGKEDVVLEIGAGIGNLTGHLIKEAKKVLAVEIDRRLVQLLRQRFQDEQKVIILHEDALHLNYSSILDQFMTPLKVVANLPFNISTPLIMTFLENKEYFLRLVLMVQKEVAKRIIAKPGTKDYGILSLYCQLFSEIKAEFDISRSCFYPSPKVDSIVLSFDLLKEPKVYIENYAYFKKVVKASFSQRRKTLKNCLKNAPLGVEEKDILECLNSLGIDPQRRGETLSLEEFARLTLTLFKRSLALISSGAANSPNVGVGLCAHPIGRLEPAAPTSPTVMSDNKSCSL